VTSLLNKNVSVLIKIPVVKPPLCSVSKLSTESVGSRRELVAIVFTPPTRRNSTVVSRRSAVCIWLYSTPQRRHFSGKVSNWTRDVEYCMYVMPLSSKCLFHRNRKLRPFDRKILKHQY